MRSAGASTQMAALRRLRSAAPDLAHHLLQIAVEVTCLHAPGWQSAGNVQAQVRAAIEMHLILRQ